MAQACSAGAEQGLRAGHVAHQPVYLTLEEVAVLCRFDATAPNAMIQACRKWLIREAVPILRRGRLWLIERAVIEAKLREG